MSKSELKRLCTQNPSGMAGKLYMAEQKIAELEKQLIERDAATVPLVKKLELDKMQFSELVMDYEEVVKKLAEQQAPLLKAANCLPSYVIVPTKQCGELTARDIGAEELTRQITEAEQRGMMKCRDIPEQGYALRKLGKRLAEMLDEDQFAECEQMLFDIAAELEEKKL